MSLDTIRRWEKNGKIKSIRTPGGHRRFSLEEIEIAKIQKEVPTTPPLPYSKDKFPLALRLISFVIVVSILLFLAKLPHSVEQFPVSFFTVKMDESGIQSVFGEYASFLSGAQFGSSTTLTIDDTGSLTTDQAVATGDLSVSGTAFLENLNLSSSLFISGNEIINSSGKIPSLIGTYIEDLDGSQLTGVDAAHLSGVASSSFLRGDKSDTAHGAINFTASPGSANIGGGPVYINPAAATANYTLFGVAVNDSSRFRVDAEGDVFIQSSLNLTGNTLNSDGDLLINPTGGLVKIGTGTPGDIDLTGGDLYVTGDAEIDGEFWNANNLRISSDGLVGIGTISSTHRLEVSGGYGGKAAVAINQTESADIFTASASGTTRFTLTNSGNATLMGSLYIQNTAGDDLRILDSSGTFRAQFSDDGSKTTIYADASGSLAFLTFDNFRIGIHDDTPDGTLEIVRRVSSDSPLLISSAAANDGDFLKITSTGLVGISTTSPAHLLHIDGGNGGNASLVVNQTESTGDIFSASASGTPKFVIDNSGKVGIGTTSQQTTLAINGTLAVNKDDIRTGDAALKLDVNGNIYASIYRGDQIQGWAAGGSFRFDDWDGSEYGMNFNATSTVDHIRFGIDSNEKMRIANSGNVGIGITSPTGLLHLDSGSTATFGKALAIFDHDEAQDLLTASASGTTKFAVASDGKLYIGDNTTLSTSTALCWETTTLSGDTVYQVGDCTGTPADLAEWYPADTTDLPEPGEIVSIGKIIGSSSSQAFLVEKASKPYDSKMVGVISAKAFEIMGEDVLEWAEEAVVVGLVGRLPVKISPSSPPIEPGDFLTSSDTPGYAVKAEEEGYTIGKALGSWTPESGKETVLVYLNQSVNLDKTETAPSTPSDIETRMTNLETQVSLLESSLLLSSGNTNNETDNSTFFADLSVLGNTVLSDTVINGKLTIGILTLDNLENSINAIGTLKIQPLALGSIEFVGGTIQMDQNGNLNIKEGIISGNDRIREAIEIEPGEALVTIEKDWDYSPVSILTTPSYKTSTWVTNISETGFTINVSSPPADRQKIYWWAIW